MSANNPATSTFPRLKIAVSACLLGEPVRYDGGHKRNAFLTEVLAKFVDYIPICPETAIGLGVPRTPIRLLGVDREQARAVCINDACVDVTGGLEDFARHSAARLGDINAYILKKGSPSCGMEGVKLYRYLDIPPECIATGIYTRVLRKTLPLLPMEEEGWLNDPVLRENFINRAYVYQRWQQLMVQGLTPKGLIDLHTRHKLLVMAHSQTAYQRLSQLLSDPSSRSIESIGQDYIHALMITLRRRVNRERHSKVLQHIAGHLKSPIDQGNKTELTAGIEAYRSGDVPLVVPVTQLRHYFQRHPDPYMENQYYFNPYPDDLRLRSNL